MVARINPYYDPAPLLTSLAQITPNATRSINAAVAGIHHVALTVSDAERSAAWYRALLGLSEIMRHDEDELSMRVLASETVMIGVRQYRSVFAEVFDEFRTGLDHIAFAVGSRDDLEAWQARLSDRNIPFTPIADAPIGSVIVVRDPDNIQLEFWLPAQT
jgi:glyoxylase I family protein